MQNIQVAPKISESKARVVAEIRNFADNPRKANDRKLVESKTKHYKPFDVSVQIFERATKKLLASKKIENFEVMPLSMKKLDVELEIPGAKLWSPESPFLYEVKVSTPDDCAAARFGMREFTSHPEEGVFKLNGKPYYLRGTNITFLRFSEDPLRGNLPWDREWVRKLYQNMKDFNFNSVRHCIGFPPDF